MSKTYYRQSMMSRELSPKNGIAEERPDQVNYRGVLGNIRRPAEGCVIAVYQAPRTLFDLYRKFQSVNLWLV